MGQHRLRRYYATLGLSEGASIEEVRQAYRRRAREVHPDLNPGDPEAERRQRELNEAYDALCAHLSAGAASAPSHAEPGRASPWTASGYAYGPAGGIPPWAPFGHAPLSGAQVWCQHAALWPTDRSAATILELLLRELSGDVGGWPRRHWADDVLDEALAALVDLARWRWRLNR